MERTQIIDSVYAISREIRSLGSPRYAPLVAAVFSCDASRSRLSTLRALEAEARKILAEVRGGAA